MAIKVTAQVFGGDPRVLDDVRTVGDVKAALNVPQHVASVNGDAASDSYELDDYAFVDLAPAIKGA